ncbi:MAG: hypothetical protein GY796_09235 [Chloroflexi bacterium]|nr:hypothetical protein [Chloroflexota bacterium]
MAHRNWGEAMGDNGLVDDMDHGPSQLGEAMGDNGLVDDMDHGPSQLGRGDGGECVGDWHRSWSIASPLPLVFGILG